MTKLINKIISLHKRRTSMRLADSEWEAMSEICRFENISRNKLIEFIGDYKDEKLGLSCSTRLFLLAYYRHNGQLKVRGARQNIINAIKAIDPEVNVQENLFLNYLIK